MIASSPLFLPILVILFSVVATADLRVGFYDATCPQAESIILSVVRDHITRDRSQSASLLQMYFNDCFTGGCDASLLINSPIPDEDKFATLGKVGGYHGGVMGRSTIDIAKRKLEEQCPSSVSCADIIALATRDAVALTGGLNYSVPTGRRDGTVSNADEDLHPDLKISIANAMKMFSDRSLTLEDMVTLIGAHSTGVAHCNFFQDRLFSFNGKNGSSDPNMDSGLKAHLTKHCEGASLKFVQVDPKTLVQYNPKFSLNQGTSFELDNLYYNQLLSKKGVLQFEQELAFDVAAAPIIASYASNATLFNQKFAEAMVKLGSLGVLVGDEGEIRESCGAFNSPANIYHQPKEVFVEDI